ncbi:MAG: DNA polymerase III subunit beta [Christensenellales bacterium]|jgi:DNA polymerase-3 subunit beta
MRFQVNANHINYGMGLISRALTAKPTKLIYEGVFIETVDKGIQLTCTDGTITIKTIVSAAVSEDGSALLPAKLLGELLRKLDGEIDIASESNAFQAMITAQGSKTSMLCMEAEDFPDIYDVVSDHVTVLPQSRLRDAVGRIIFAVASDENRKILTGCLMETYAEEVRFVCLDGFRLGMQRAYVKNEIPMGQECLAAILPGKTIGEIAHMMPESDEPVRIVCSATHMMAAFDNTKVYSPLIAGEYINYKQILPTTWTTAVRVDRAALIGAIDRAALMAREGKNNLLKLQFTDETLTISAYAERGAAVERLPIDFEGSPLDISFNARYLLDVIRNIDTEDISMRFNTNVSPCVICPVEGNQYTYLVLPVRTID